MTPFGKAVRKERIERHMLLGEMADRLGITSSYLSQIESGKRVIPEGLPSRVAAMLDLDGVETANLNRLAIQSTGEFRIQAQTPRDRELANTFATELARLTPEQKTELERVFRKD